MSKHSILIACLSERQSFNSGLDLAWRLASLGHRAVFVGQNSRAMEEHIKANGFEFLGLGPVEEELAHESANANLVGRARIMWNAARQMNRDIEDFGRRYSGQFNLLLLDVLVSPVAAYIGRLVGVPIIVFCSGYSSRLSASYPPAVCCQEIPSTGGKPMRWEKVRNLALWSKTLVMASARQLATPNPLLTLTRVLLLLSDWRYRRKARRLGARFCYGDWGIRLEAPEVALAVKSIDWPILQRCKTRLYLNRVSAARKEFLDVDWRAGLDPNKPLVYCSLGALFGENIWKDKEGGVLHPRCVPYKLYLDVVIAAAASRPEWQLLIASGHLDQAFAHDRLPPNVRVLRWVRQDEVLAGSRLGRMEPSDFLGAGHASLPGEGRQKDEVDPGGWGPLQCLPSSSAAQCRCRQG